MTGKRTLCTPESISRENYSLLLSYMQCRQKRAVLLTSKGLKDTVGDTGGYCSLGDRPRATQRL